MLILGYKKEVCSFLLVLVGPSKVRVKRKSDDGAVEGDLISRGLSVRQIRTEMVEFGQELNRQRFCGWFDQRASSMDCAVRGRL